MGRRLRFVAVLSAIALLGGGLILSCTHDGDGGSSEGERVRPFSFDNNTSLVAGGGAGVATAAFAAFGLITGGVLESLTGMNGNSSLGARPMVPVPIIGFCTTGTATVDWNDADTSLDLSAGDSVTLALDNCAGSLISFAPASGTVAFAVTSVGGAIPVIGGIISADVTLDLSIVDSSSRTDIDGNFPLDVNIPLTLNLANLFLGLADSDAIITVSEDGKTLFDIACFDVYQRVLLGIAGIDLFQPVGVAKILNRIYTINDYTLPADNISFDISGGDIVPEFGSMELFSGDESGGICTSFSRGATSDGSRAMFIFTGGGDVTVEGEDKDGNFFVFDTTWEDLLDSL